MFRHGNKPSADVFAPIAAGSIRLGHPENRIEVSVPPVIGPERVWQAGLSPAQHEHLRRFSQAQASPAQAFSPEVVPASAFS
jgi:hypothetical protein